MKARLLAVCHTCQHRHAISEHDLLRTDFVRDWEQKHRSHRIEFLDASAYDVSIARHAVGDYKHNADVKLAYAAAVDYTITLASLAVSASLLAGRESSEIDNGTNLYLDWIIGGKITTGSSGAAAGDLIQVLAIAPIKDEAAVEWPDVFDGTDSVETISSNAVKNQIGRYVASFEPVATANSVHPLARVSLATLFGIMPRHHVLFVTHDTAGALNATGSNQLLTGTGVYATVI